MGDVAVVYLAESWKMMYLAESWEMVYLADGVSG